MNEAVKVACVQAEAVILDRTATIDKLAGLAAEAAEGGAKLALFPEALRRFVQLGVLHHDGELRRERAQQRGFVLGEDAAEGGKNGDHFATTPFQQPVRFSVATPSGGHGAAGPSRSPLAGDRSNLGGGPGSKGDAPAGYAFAGEGASSPASAPIAAAPNAVSTSGMVLFSSVVR